MAAFQDGGYEQGVFESRFGLVVGKTELSVLENGTAECTVALSSKPPAKVTVTVTRTAGDTDLTVSSGSTLIDSTNWTTLQAITIAAGDDSDGISGTATFLIFAKDATNQVVLSAIEVDDDHVIPAYANVDAAYIASITGTLTSEDVFLGGSFLLETCLVYLTDEGRYGRFIFSGRRSIDSVTYDALGDVYSQVEGISLGKSNGEYCDLDVSIGAPWEIESTDFEWKEVDQIVHLVPVGGAKFRLLFFGF